MGAFGTEEHAAEHLLALFLGQDARHPEQRRAARHEVTHHHQEIQP